MASRNRIPHPIVVRLGRGVSSAARRTDRYQPHRIRPDVACMADCRARGRIEKATDIKVLDLTGITSFADWFVIARAPTRARCRRSPTKSPCASSTGRNTRPQPGRLHPGRMGVADFGDMLVHIFSPKARAYYDLERLWRAVPIRSLVCAGWHEILGYHQDINVAFSI